MTESQPQGSDAALRRRPLTGFLGILTGSGLAQLLALAAVPLLSRVYPPAQTAHYALLVGISAVLASFASLRLDLAIPIPADEADSRRLFWLAVMAPVLVLPIVGLLALVVVSVGAWHPLGLVWLDFVAVAAFVVVLGLFSAGSQLAIRLRSYGVLGRIPVVQMIGTLVAQIALGAVGISRGLFLGALVGRSLGIAGLLRSADVRVAHAPSRAEARRLLARFWRFPLFFAPAGLVNVLGFTLPALVLPSLFGFGQAGLYAMADRIAGVPVNVLGQSAGQVFLGEFARARSIHAARRVFLRWSVALLLLGLSVASAIWILAPSVLPWILGEGWAGISPLAQYTGIMAGSAIIGSPVQQVWTVRQRGLMQFAWNLTRLAVGALVLGQGAQSGDSLVGVVRKLAIATTAMYALAWLGCLWAAVRPSAGEAGASEDRPAGPTEQS